MIDETNHDCLIGLGKAYAKINELDKAIEFTVLATESKDSVAMTFFYLGMLYLKKKDYKNG